MRINDRIPDQRALAKIISELENISWQISVNTDIGQQMTNSCIFFRKVVVTDQTEKDFLSRDGDIFTFSPSSYGNLLLIDVPQHIEKDLLDSIKAVCRVSDYKQLETVDGVTVTSKLGLAGFSWRAWGEDSINVRKMILNFVVAARKHKYELVTNLNTKGTTDSLLFRHKKSLQADLKEEMMMISLNRDDRMRLIACPGSIITVVEEVITQHWEGGLQHSKEKTGFWEFKLAGYPWWASGEDTVKSRYLIANLIMKLKSVGWEVAVTLDVSRRLNDKAVFVFRWAQCPPQTQPYAVLSFHEKDKMRFLSSSHDGQAVEAGIDRILASANIIQDTKPYWKAKQWKIRGVPFSGAYCWGEDQRMILQLLTRVMKLLHQQGWRVVASADVSAKYFKSKDREYPLDNHSWFLLYDPNTRTELS